MIIEQPGDLCLVAKLEIFTGLSIQYCRYNKYPHSMLIQKTLGMNFAKVASSLANFYREIYETFSKYYARFHYVFNSG